MIIEMNNKDDKEKLLSSSQDLLSNEFKNWYGSLIGKDVLKNWRGHPHFYFQSQFDPSFIINRLSRKDVEEIASVEDINNNDHPADYYLTSGEQIQKKLTPLIGNSLTEYLQYMPPITSADLMQNNEKISKLLTVDLKEWYVVIEIDDPVSVISNLQTLHGLTTKFNTGNKNRLKVDVLEDWVLLGENGRHFLISPFMGQTVEKLFKETQVSSNTRGKILTTLKRFATFCEQEGTFWRDLAPRNILIPFNGQDLLVFIDYEHLYKTTELTSPKRKTLDISRRIWFGDILTQEEIDNLFGDLANIECDLDISTRADALERVVYSKQEITLREKFALQEKTAFIEKRHTYGDTSIYGHRIGRYLTDFVPAKDEAKLYSALRVLDHETFNRYLYLVQRCIDNDSGNMLAGLCNVSNTGFRLTPVFLGEIEQNLSDETKLLGILDKYEVKIM